MVDGSKVKIARELVGWTQAYLAVRADVRITTIMAYESGKIYPLKSAAVAIEAALVQAGINFSVEGQALSVPGTTDPIALQCICPMQ